MALSVCTPEGDWYDYRVTSLPDPGTAQDAELILPLRYLLMLAAAPAFFDGALSFVRRGTPGREPQVLFRLPLRGAVLDILGENPVHLARLLSNPAALSRQSLRPLQEGCPGKGQVPSGRELALKIRGKGRAEPSGPAGESPSSPLAEEMRAWLEKDSRFVLPEAQDPGIRLSLVHIPTKDVVPLSLSTVQTLGPGGCGGNFSCPAAFFRKRTRRSGRRVSCDQIQLAVRSDRRPGETAAAVAGSRISPRHNTVAAPRCRSKVTPWICIDSLPGKVWSFPVLPISASAILG